MRKPNAGKQIRITSSNINNAIREAGDVLRNGGVIIHATETVYGLATRWDVEASLKRVADLKHRGIHQPFSIMVNSLEQIVAILGELPENIHRFLQRLFPAPVTVLIPRTHPVAVPYWNHFPYLGFRYPSHELSVQLVTATGVPLITTSANLSGQPPAQSVDEIPANLRHQVDLILDSGKIEGGVPSTIVRITEDWQTLELVREGPVPLEKILRFFEHN